MAAHQYWRLYITAAGAGAGTDPACITMMGFYAADGTLLSTGGTASALSTNGGNSPSKAFDTNDADGWVSGNNPTSGSPNWIEYAFSAPVDPKVLVVKQSYSPWSIRTWKLQYSDDNSTWTDVFSVNSAWGDTYQRSYGINPAADCYAMWRVNGTTSHVSGQPAVAELEFHAVTGGANVASQVGATSDITSGGLPATSAFDGNASTYWGLGVTGTHWLGNALTSCPKLAEIVMKARNDASFGQAFDNFDVQGSNDGGANWTTVQHFTATWVSAGQSQTFTLIGAPAFVPRVMFIC